LIALLLKVTLSCDMNCSILGSDTSFWPSSNSNIFSPDWMIS
jgi:hypothetical protein